MKIELPVGSVDRALQGDYGAVFRSGGIMFFRPSPQSMFSVAEESETHDVKVELPQDVEPVIALLDGVPLVHHAMLNGFINIDDPDDYLTTYQPAEMGHGTAMASLICHGELDDTAPSLMRRIYARPIMLPVEGHPFPRPEKIPERVFFEDLIERSVRRIFEGDEDGEPVAPSVKIINLSVGDPNRIFHSFPGPTARLLDWLSFKYRVLFCVSAGNMQNSINVGIDDQAFQNLSDGEKVAAVMTVMDNDKRNRRLLSPAESINAITVGSVHDDCSDGAAGEGRLDIFPARGLPSPLTSHGHGFNSSIKPDILLPGGRQLYSYSGGGLYDINQSGFAPGQKVAAPPKAPGEINRTIYTRGTSNANALATRGAGFIYEALLDLFADNNIETPTGVVAALIKSLLVHGAEWGERSLILQELLRLTGREKKIRVEETARFLGYGIPDISKVVACTENRATAVGFGEIDKDDKHEFILPLPPSLRGVNDWRRLTISLAWQSPINPNNRQYRVAALKIVPPVKGGIGGERTEAWWQQVIRGTVQHEIFEGEEVLAFQEGDNIVISVECREDASSLEVSIPYGIAVSLEVKEDVGIPVYEEIREGIEIAIAEQIGIQ